MGQPVVARRAVPRQPRVRVCMHGLSRQGLDFDVLRGAQCGLLPAATTPAMTLHGPRKQLHELTGAGHALAPVQDARIEVLRRLVPWP